MSECVLSVTPCVFPNLFILSPTRYFLYNFPKHQRLHLPEHPTTAARLMEETLRNYSVWSAQWYCFNPKFYFEISHYVCEPSSKKFYQHCLRMQITLKRQVQAGTQTSPSSMDQRHSCQPPSAPGACIQLWQSRCILQRSGQTWADLISILDRSEISLVTQFQS